MAKFDVRAFGLACGIVWAAGVCALGIFSFFLDWGRIMVAVLASLYPGYSSALPGIIAGTLWAFVDGALFGVLFAWLYNKIARKEQPFD